MGKNDIHSKQVDVLLVEDNPGDVRLVQEALSEDRTHIMVHVVSDGAEALEFLRRTGRFGNAVRPDFVLLDLNLPRKDGREVLGAVKGDPALKSIPVIVLTTSGSEDDVARCYALNANCYVMKPIDLFQFLDAIRSIVDFWVNTVRLPKKG